MKIVKKTICYLMFFTYWGFTFLFIFPNNPIKAKLKKSMFDFNLFFRQTWSFFAPPPKSNSRLYYSFFDKNKDEIKSFEIMEPLLYEKRKKAPFNTEEEILDYMLSGVINNIYGMIQTQRGKLQLEYRNLNNFELEQIAKDSIVNNLEKIKPFKTLIKYSSIVAKNNLTSEQYKNIKYLKIIISEAQIPKFIDRYANNTSIKETLALKTGLIKF